jgi:hypothetical protein
MATVKNLKILKGVLYAEVTVGITDIGAAVSMNVKIGRTEDPAINAALAQLNEAVAAIAERHMQQASDNKIIDKRVDDRLVRMRKQHEQSLDVQRRTVYAKVAQRLRQKLQWIQSHDSPDSVRTIMADLALEFDRESEKKTA